LVDIIDLREIQDEVLFLFQLYRQYTFAVWHIQLHVLNDGMFQVTVLSEPNLTVPEFLPDQTTLSNVPQKNTMIIVQKNAFVKNNPIFYLSGLLDGLRTSYGQAQRLYLPITRVGSGN
jgi:hypothetical protein